MTPEAAESTPDQRSKNRGGRQGPGPYSRALTRGVLNRRTREGRYAVAYEAELIKHIGGNPSIVQRRIVERCAMLALHLMIFDEKALKEGGLTPRDSREYLALHGWLTKTLLKLGVRSASDEPQQPSLNAYLTARASRQPEPDDDEPAPPSSPADPPSEKAEP